MKIRPADILRRRKLGWHRDGECIICTSHCVKNDGYPIVRRNGKTLTWARLILFRRYGNQPTDVHCRHTCDNRLCVNPNHLIPGRNEDNVRDRCERGRTALADKHFQTKLNPDKVRNIRRLLQSRSMTWVDIAKRFGISTGTIRNIQIGRAWRYVQ